MITRRLMRVALVAFLVSRVLFFGLAIFTSQLSFLRKTYDGTIWETRLELTAERLTPELVRTLMIGDAWWYQSIAVHGYGARAEADGVPNYAFFPLYPLVVRSVPITGSFALDGMIVSNLAFAAALVLLAAIAMRRGLSEDDAARAVMYLAFFPTSYFLSMPLTEALFLVLVLACILAALHDRWALAGAIGGAAALTRVPGLLLVVPLAVHFFLSDPRPRWRALWLLCVPAGTATFSLYLNQVTGDFLAFSHAHGHWQRQIGPFWEPLLAYVRRPWVASEPWNPLLLNFGFAVLLGVCAIALLLRRDWMMGSYALASILLPLSTGSLQSIGRYAAVTFPLFLWLSVMGRDETRGQLLLGSSVTLYGWLIALLFLRVDLAMA